MSKSEKIWFFVFVSIVIIAILVVCALIVKTDFANLKAERETCHPYAVMTHYQHKGQLFVVCGNEEHKKVVAKP